MKAFIYVGGKVEPSGITEKPTSDDLVLAADSGYLNAERLGAEVNLLLGDFDSLGEPSVPDEVEVLRVPAEKDLTDTQLAVQAALDRGARELVLIGGLSGRLDHTLSNLSILEELCAKRIRATITDGKNRVRLLRNDSVLIPRAPHFRYLSLICVDPVVKGVTVEGCKYPLKNAKLTRQRQFAVSNEILGNCALVSVRRGTLQIIESAD